MHIHISVHLSKKDKLNHYWVYLDKLMKNTVTVTFIRYFDMGVVCIYVCYIVVVSASVFSVTFLYFRAIVL